MYPIKAVTLSFTLDVCNIIIYPGRLFIAILSSLLVITIINKRSYRYITNGQTCVYVVIICTKSKESVLKGDN